MRGLRQSLGMFDSVDNHRDLLYKAQTTPIVITEIDVAAMLDAYNSNLVSHTELLDWANRLIFDDAFVFDGDAIRDCLDRIEESDEPGNELSESDIVHLKESLGRTGDQLTNAVGGTEN